MHAACDESQFVVSLTEEFWPFIVYDMHLHKRLLGILRFKEQLLLFLKIKNKSI